MLCAFALFLVYMIIPCFLWSPMYEQMVIAPLPADPAKYEYAVTHAKYKPEDHFFPNKNGDKLHGWFFKNPDSNKVVLIHHGNAGNISTRWQLPELIRDCGASVFLYDYRGYGKSTGEPGVAKIIEDGSAAADYVTDKLGYRPEQIVHYGESIGSGVACDVAAHRKSGGMVFHSGVASLPNVWRSVFKFLQPYPDFLFPVPQIRNAEMVRDVHAPVLLFAAIPDTIVSYHNGEAIYANANEPKELVLFTESSHNCTLGGDCDKFVNAMRKFLQTTI
jgi:uncharacterized protein